MRAWMLVPLCILAGCSETTDTAKAEEAPEATMLDAGQWQVSREVTRLTQADKGNPAIDTPAGTKSASQACVGEAERKKPDPALFAEEGESCTYKNFYMGNGRLNVSLACERPKLSGSVLKTVEATFTASGIDGTSRIDTYLASDGDVKIDQKIVAKHIGACAAG